MARTKSPGPFTLKAYHRETRSLDILAVFATHDEAWDALQRFRDEHPDHWYESLYYPGDGREEVYSSPTADGE